MSINDLTQALTYFLAMLFALTFHEAAHAFASHSFGDDSAKREGRLSLNPTVHMDMVGTVALPLVCSVLGAPFIGWAKPVPYDERNFKNPTRDVVLTAAAGPLANLFLSFVCLIIFLLNDQLDWAIFAKGSFLAPLMGVVGAMIYVNGILAFLNLIPLPPLDGATIMRAFMDRNLWERYEMAVAPWGFVIILVLASMGGLNWISGLTAVYVSFMEALASPILSLLL
jgi:Zn-dependent protease